MASDTAMLTDRNDLPEPGLNDVTQMTLLWSALSVMNSKLVRSTRKASLMMSRLPSLTTTALRCGALRCKRPVFCVSNCGISPTNGTERASRSLRPRILVFIDSRRYITTTGMSKPITRPHSSILLRTGAVGLRLPLGGVMMRVL